MVSTFFSSSLQLPNQSKFFLKKSLFPFSQFLFLGPLSLLSPHNLASNFGNDEDPGAVDLGWCFHKHAIRNLDVVLVFIQLTPPKDHDADQRYMALSDLTSELGKTKLEPALQV